MNFERSTTMTEGVEFNFDELAEVYQKKASVLKDELNTRWMSKFDNIEHENEMPGLLKELEDHLEKMQIASIDRDLEIHKDVSLKTRQAILELHNSITNTLGDTNYFLGNGASAEVYTLPAFSEFCVKYITKQDAYNENNHMRHEYSFLDQLHKFEHDGVRTPCPYFLRIHPGEGGHSYGMEKIDGQDLSWLLQRPTEHLDLIIMLKEMDRAAMEESLVSYVEEMHKKFNITHNDLFKRNIMCDQNGNLYIIDFGKARREDLGEDHERFRKSDLTRIRTEIRDFFQELDKININDMIE